MEPDDIPRVVAIDRRSFPNPWSPTSYLHELRYNPRSLFYVLLRPSAPETPDPPRWQRWLDALRDDRGQESRVIGYVGLRRKGQPPAAHLSTIAIHPDWRGHGLGELLLLTAIEQALAHEFKHITLEVRPSNHVAQRLYRKYRFELTGVHPKYYRDGEDALLMAVDPDGPDYRSRLGALRRALEARLRGQRARVGQIEPDTL